MGASPAAPSFQGYTLRQAEEELVGACMDCEESLRTVLRLLPLHPFRSEVAADLDRVLYTLAGWLSRGAYDRDTNRERLIDLAGGEPLERCIWDGYLDGLWSPGIYQAGYVEALCRALCRCNQLQDAAVAAARARLFDNPFSDYGPARASVAAASTHGRSVGGIGVAL